MKNIAIAGLCLAFCSPCQAAGSESSWSSAQGFSGFTRQTPFVFAPSDAVSVQGKNLAEMGQNDGFITLKNLSSLPATDPKIAAWLASRIPGLKTASLKTVPAEPIDAIMTRAAAAHASYLDIFTDPGLGRSNPDLFYLSQDVLDKTNRKWISGTMPVSGTTADGKAFHMQALVIGNGTAYILYDFLSFEFKDNGHDFRIVDGGRVSVNTLGAADVGVSGIKVHGCKGPFCAWADIQRMTKIGADQVRVKTNKGDQNAPLKPVRAR